MAEQRGLLASVRPALMAAHQSAVLRRDAAGQETLLNLLLRSYLDERQYDQVGGGAVDARCLYALRRLCWIMPSACPPATELHTCRAHCRPQAEKFRAQAQKSDTWRLPQQYCRYLFYLGCIR